MAGRSRLLLIGLPLIGIATFALATLSIVQSNFAKGPSEPQKGASDLSAPTNVGRDRIYGLGTIEPVDRQTDVSARTAGIVNRVFVTAGDKVHAGDILFEIDKTVAAATIEQRRRDLATAEERLAETEAKFSALQAEVDAARNVLAGAVSDADEAADLVRFAGQLGPSSVSEREATRRKNAQRTAEARVAEVRARLARAEAERDLVDPQHNGATIRIEQATIDQAKAALALAEAEAALTVVKAPIDATVLAVNIHAGEYANPAAATAPIVLGQLDPLHVRVEIDEADVPRFMPQSTARLTLRGSAGTSLPLRFVRSEPQITPKRTLTGTDADRVDTRVLQIIYAVGRSPVRLWPGQLVDVMIGGAGS